MLNLFLFVALLSMAAVLVNFSLETKALDRKEEAFYRQLELSKKQLSYAVDDSMVKEVSTAIEKAVEEKGGWNNIG